MIVFVERIDKVGAVTGVYAQPQSGYAEEELPDDDPEVIVYYAALAASLLPTPRMITDEAERVACKADATLLSLINQTRAEWATWAGANFPTLTVAERTRMGVICWMLAVAIRRVMRV